LVIAIDGPAGVGKSTLARHLADRWNLHYLNTGRYYRTVTLLALEQGLLAEDAPTSLASDARRSQELAALASRLSWGFDETAVIADGRRFAADLHSAAVDRWVALVSALPAVREALNRQFRSLSASHDLVSEGRDVTSAVFPAAEVRIFLDASPEVRARRRFEERAEGHTFEQVLQAIEERDRIDRTKPVGALKLTPGCVAIDSSRLTIKDVCE
jgi:cytidylate kinase